MNRRGFISMMAGAAGALVLPKWRIPDPVISMPSDFSTDNLVFTATERYSLGWTDPRSVFGSAPLKAEGALIDYDAVGAAYARALRASMLQTRLMVMDQVLRREMHYQYLTFPMQRVELFDETA